VEALEHVTVKIGQPIMLRMSCINDFKFGGGCGLQALLNSLARRHRLARAAADVAVAGGAGCSSEVHAGFQ
jgi:hypothetical protein